MLVAYAFAGWSSAGSRRRPSRSGSARSRTGGGPAWSPRRWCSPRGLLTVPGLSPDVAEAVRQPGLTQASALLLHLTWLLFVPGMLLLAPGGRFTAVAAGVTAFALLHFSGLMVGDYSDLAVRLTVPADTR